MSLDLAITSWKVSEEKTAWSLILVPAISMKPFPQSITSSGDTTPSLRAVAAVTILKMLPGSVRVGDRAVHPVFFGKGGEAIGIEGGRLDMAGTSPVRGSRTTAVPRSTRVADRLAERHFGYMLDPLIDGEGHLPAFGGGLSTSPMGRRFASSRTVTRASRPLRSSSRRARAGHAPRVEAHVAENRRKEIAFRVVPAALRFETDALPAAGPAPPSRPRDRPDA